MTAATPKRTRTRVGQAAPQQAQDARPRADTPPEEAETPREAESESTPEPAPAPRSTGTGHPSLQWGFVVETIYRIDPRHDYDRLTTALAQGEGITEYGVVLGALDAAERNAFDAKRLYAAARVERERVLHAIATEREVLRTAARDSLEAEKAAGTRSKAPTLDDIKDRMVADYGDKVMELKLRETEITEAVGVIEQLVDSWRSRAASLRAALEGARR